MNIKEMTPQQLIQLLFTIGKIGKDIWDNLKNTSSPRLKWRREIVEVIAVKDQEILALKLLAKHQGEKLEDLERRLLEVESK